MYDNRSTIFNQDKNRLGAAAGQSQGFPSLLSVIQEDEDAMCDDIVLQPSVPSSSCGAGQESQNIVTDLKTCKIKKSSQKSIKSLAKVVDDEDCFVDEDALMNEPLQLITRNRAMKVDSGLIRQQQPAV